MGLWGSFGRSFQHENTTRTIRIIRTIADSDTRKSNSAYSASFAYIDTNLKEAQQGEAPAAVEPSPMPEPVEEPKADASGVVITAVSMGWGVEPGEVDAVAAMARERFPEPPIDGRAFPYFPTFCAGYGEGCGACRFFRMGRGPFCAVWGAAWPKFQRDAETDKATW